jgi:hypothetical protein
MKKRYFTLKNGAFYPRIQSILAFFLSVFWEIKIKLFCGRKWRWRKWDLWEIIKCEIVMCVWVSLPARALRTRGTSGTRPPTSCRAFLLRTLPPPPNGWTNNHKNWRKRKHRHPSFVVVRSTIRGVSRARLESSPALHEVGGPHPPSPPLPPQRPKSSKK